MAESIASSTVLTAEQVRAIDADVASQGHGYETMQRAAAALFQKVCELLDQGRWAMPVSLRPPRRSAFPTGWREAPVLVFAGQGNNGGDGVLLALLLRQAKRSVRLVLLQSPEGFHGDAAKAWQQYSAAGGAADVLPDAKVLQEWNLGSCGLIVDALFGTGFHDSLQGLAVEVVNWINSSGCPVLAVDVPSGVSPMVEVHPELCVRADWTLLMGFPRIECCTQFPGDVYGQWDFAALGYSDELLKQNVVTPSIQLLTPRQVAHLLPSRSLWGDKRSQGVVGTVAGSRGMTGAAMLCVMASMRCGAGMVHLACPSSEMNVLSSRLLEVVMHPQDSVEGVLQSSALNDITTLLSRCDVGCVGPGLSTHNEAQLLVRQLCLNVDIPLIIDADGLNAFRGYAAVLRGLKHVPVLTPHEGEWDRLFRIPAGSGWSRVDALRSRATEFNCVIVLKGAPTLIGTPEGDVYVVPVANSGLATAGSGDVLAGVIASMRAQGASAVEAALLGTWMHARAGLWAVEAFGQRGALPSDLIDKFPQVLLEMEQMQA